jgi:hypothetical protein
MLRRLTLLRAPRTLLYAALLVVCLAPLHAQSKDPMVATVLQMRGQVSIERMPGDLVPVSVNTQIKRTQVIVTGVDGWAQCQYSDGSVFEIFPKSKVVFHEQPTDWEHLLNVWIGHVKVWIQHAPGVPNYKNVSTPTAVISVRGTVFEVIVEDEDSTTVSVDEGLVDVMNVTAPNGRIPRLHAGEAITVYRNQPLGLNQNGKPLNNNVWDIAKRAVYEAVWQMNRGGAGPLGGPGGIATGPNADKGKNTGSGNGGKAPTGPTAPSAPSAPTPPPAPPAPPGGGH